jgi:SAM-dependent methyltransferase
LGTRTEIGERGEALPITENVDLMLSQLLEAEKAITCGEESKQNYFSMHKERFADILRLCRSHVPDPSARVLDIGRSELTAYLLNFYKNIHTLGLDPSVDDGGHREVSRMDAVPHITFDLLNSHTVSNWPDCGGKFDLIVFSEVIEHLCLAPEFVLAALNSLLAENGVLICTTPNAADLAKRLRLAFGRNPYERLRLYAVNPGHIREYTRQELCDIADSVGLSCKSYSYFDWIKNKSGNPIKSVIMKLLRAYPAFRPFQVCVLTKKRGVGAAQ